MARELISDSLIKSAMEGPLVGLKSQVMQNSRKSKNHELRINTETNDLSMSSWTIKSAI
jgi:hypothetical protein